MNKNITTLYVTNKDNITVAFGSNLTDLYRMFKNICPDARNYQYYYRQFQSVNEFEWDGYRFQKLL